MALVKASEIRLYQVLGKVELIKLSSDETLKGGCIIKSNGSA